MPQLHTSTAIWLEKSQAIFDGQLVPFNQAKLSIASSPVLYGLAIYSVCLVRPSPKGSVIFRLNDHYRRLCASARILGIGDISAALPFEQFENHIKQLVQANPIDEDALVRMSVYVDELAAGTRITGLNHNFYAYLYPAGELLPKRGAHLAVSSWRRTPDNSIPSRAKINGSYVNASLAKNQALLDGYDDAILLDQADHVTESTVANIFTVKQGHLLTPAVSADLLEGITRDTIFSLAAERHWQVEERPVDRSELYTADEIFLCGSSARLTPVLSIDHHLVGDGKIGNITKQLTNDYDQLTSGRLVLEPDWLTLVSKGA